ncbi:MAG: polyamine aminopropyltransferase [Methylophilaceae bacterium]
MLRIGAKIARSIHRKIFDSNSVDVSEVDGIRSLHLGNDTVQSAMRVKSPYALELAYSRGMMGFLLFSEKIENVLTIGLGGGSVPKYIHQYLPQISQRVVEINPQVIGIARSHFYLPQDDERLEVIETDGIAYLQEHPSTTQLLMIDAFDSKGIPANMGSQDFFDSCVAALTHNGMMAINLWGSDKKFDVYLQRIEQSFSQRVLVLPTGRPGNIIVFGFCRVPKDLRWVSLRDRAKLLEAQHEIEFMKFVEKLRDNNDNTSNRLII